MQMFLLVLTLELHTHVTLYTHPRDITFMDQFLLYLLYRPICSALIMDSNCKLVVNISIPFRSRFILNHLLPFHFMTVSFCYHLVSLPFHFITVSFPFHFRSHTVAIDTELGSLYRRTIFQRKWNVIFLLTPPVLYLSIYVSICYEKMSFW